MDQIDIKLNIEGKNKYRKTKSKCGIKRNQYFFSLFLSINTVVEST